MSGSFSLYYDDLADVRTKLTEWSLSILPGGSSTPVEFIPPSSTVKTYVLVFAGTLGAETNAVTGKVLDINPITPIPCGQPVNAGGGTAGYDQIHELGTDAGQVELDFEAYSIPDAIQVTPDNNTNNQLVSSNGLVSGFNVYKFNYDSNSLGTTKVRVKVTGNNDSNTRWVFTLGCPGQNLNNSDRAAKRVGVAFNFGINVAGGALGDSCRFDVYVDGKKIGTGSGLGSGFNIKLTEGMMHSVTYGNVSCDGFRTGFSASFTDSRGTVSIPSPKFSPNANFLINVQ